jgi:hypothetical protein
MRAYAHTLDAHMLADRICSLLQAKLSCNERIAALALPVVVACSRTVLQRFVEDDRKAGKMPLPRYARNSAIQRADRTSQGKAAQNQSNLPDQTCVA